MFSPADPDTGDIAQRANGSTLHSAPSVLRIENLKVTLPLDAGRPYAINDVSFDIQPNETVCVVGESGSGKTLLSLAVLRYLPRGVHVSQGRILFAGRDMATFSKREIQDIRGKRISMIFQEPMVSLNPTMTIGHQLEEIFLCHETMNAKERQEAVFEALADVDLHDVKRAYSSYPHQISGGQCQRVCIAMALALRPSLLIADEPTTALDVTTQRIILDLFMRLREKHQYACMFVTHDLAVVREIADRVVVMRHGQAVEMGAADAVLQHPRHAYTQRLLASIPPMEIDAREPLPSQAPVVVNAQDIKRSFTKQNKVVQVIKGVSFTVQRGSCLAIVGESGSGKSTLARCLVRLLRVDSGRIVILGKDIAHLKGTQLRHHRRRIQMIFQDPFGALNPQKTVENLIGRGLTLQGVPKKEIRERSKALLKIVGLDESALNRRSHAFSGGQRQRIAIAQAVALSPAVLIADESVSALDVSIQAQILDLLEQLRKQLDITIIFITHDLRVAARISDHVGVMNQGQLVEFGRTKEIFDNPQHIYTQTLLNSAPARHWLPPKLKASLYEESPDSVMDLSSIMAP